MTDADRTYIRRLRTAAELHELHGRKADAETAREMIADVLAGRV